MPLVNTGEKQSGLNTLAGGYRNFATAMAAQGVNQNQQASAGLNKEKTIGEQMRNKAAQEGYTYFKNQQHQPGTQVVDNMAVDRPLNSDQISQNADFQSLANAQAFGKGSPTPMAMHGGQVYSTVGGGIEGLNPDQEDRQAQAIMQKHEADSVGTAAADAGKTAFTQEGSLRKEFTANTKNFAKINDAWSKIRTSFARGTPASDMAGIFAYMKMLDPDSTVRESEYATVENTGSIPQRVWQAFNKAKQGTLMLPEVRADFLQSAGGLFNDEVDAYDLRKQEIMTLAERYKLNPENVTYNRQTQDRYQQQGVISTPEEYDALAPGTTYQDANGVWGVKK